MLSTESSKQISYRLGRVRQLDVNENEELARLGRRMARVLKNREPWAKAAAALLVYEAANIQRGYDHARRHEARQVANLACAGAAL